MDTGFDEVALKALESAKNRKNLKNNMPIKDETIGILKNTETAIYGVLR